jgi:phage head maturation protease
MAGYTWDDMDRQDVIRVITKLDLVEISVVSIPANPYALFKVAKKFFDLETKSIKSLAMQAK